MPLEDNRWSITTIDVRTKAVYANEYDAVMICNGHYNVPSLPYLPGKDIFAGKQMHSHDYRRPEPFKGQNVLIIGAGPSGMDLALHISYHAETVSSLIFLLTLESFCKLP